MTFQESLSSNTDYLVVGILLERDIDAWLQSAVNVQSVMTTLVRGWLDSHEYYRSQKAFRPWLQNLMVADQVLDGMRIILT